ncbi:citrate synthase/methylcitrate synthase [Alicyclobacillus shizuokensis]|uniref:citrate synthase/methylcitrate synthase n=1 Tax=Alicyclobacillus shizuokensis TaxID=392014 RepID=UPI00082C5AE7|nr:citrate synthase/methylcitrate synthase [Alicyclobacillus shizuokensis]MCL6624950.1 citrate synthase/methylcitrate synthase [Alicyclobacillus shizuokensis]
MAQTNGLEGVVAAETELSLVDGEKGELVYRGYVAQDLAKSRSFEEVAYLLWYGRLPDPAETARLVDAFKARRQLPDRVRTLIDSLPADHDMMSVLRTALSALASPRPWPPARDDAAHYAALIPEIIAFRQARLQGREPLRSDPTLSHVANYLYLLTGQKPADEHVRALEAYLILTMEHGMNASTFAARVVTSTQSDMASALTAALGAMKGPLHGGAPSGVIDMLEQIGSPESAEAWLRKKLSADHRLMGFGHRVYKTNDPRARALRDIVAQMADKDAWFHLATHVEETAVRLLEEYKPGRRLYTNVEYWAATILRAVEIPKSLYTATFSLSRTVGWTAHILEQAENNRLIRPQSVYVGALPQGAAKATE